MKKRWGFAMFALLLVVMSSAIWLAHMNDTAGYIESRQHEDENDTVPFTGSIQEQVHKGDLLLVNNQYPISRDSIKTDIVDVSKQEDRNPGFVLMDSKLMLSQEVLEQFQYMIAAAAEDGIHSFLMSSGYRDWDKQEELYQQKGADYALPAGHSEHNLGLSLDIGSTVNVMEEAPEGKWLAEHSWKYGFILRYPRDRSDITGIQYEPWHFRYVGLPHSAIMYQKNLVLEQYLDLLQEKKDIDTTVGNDQYHIRYYDATSATTILLPQHGDYDISGDNKQGIIVTVRKQ